MKCYECGKQIQKPSAEIPTGYGSTPVWEQPLCEECAKNWVKKAHLGGITKDINGKYIFKIGFQTREEAQYYKDRIKRILQTRNYHVENTVGYHDKEARQ